MSSISTNPKDSIGRTKPPLHLIPAAAMIQEAVVMGLGAEKYGPFNWRSHSVAASVYIAAALRHINQWFDGESTDPESGASHLAHARASLGILLDADATGNMVDDRPPVGMASSMIQLFTDFPPKPHTQLGIDVNTAETLPSRVSTANLPDEVLVEAGALPCDSCPDAGCENCPNPGAPEMIVVTDQDIRAIGEVIGQYRGFDILSVGALPTVVYLTPTLGETENMEYTSPVPEATLAPVVTEEQRDVVRGELRSRLAAFYVLKLGCHEIVANHIAGGTSWPESFLVDLAHAQLGRRDMPETPRTVYIAGPMRGYDDFNYPAFHDARDRFLGLGYAVVSPADIDAAADGGNEHEYDHSQRSYVYRDLMTLMNFGDEDAIAMLPGWEQSTGAVAEFMVARWLGIRILDARTGVPLDPMQLDSAGLIGAPHEFLADRFQKFVARA